MLFQRSLALLIAIAILAVVAPANAQDQTRFVLKLNDELVKNLRSFGSLTSNVEDQFKQRISMIEIQYAGNASAPALTNNASITINSDVAAIQITDEMLASIKSQPIRILVSEDKRDFSKIALNYEMDPSANATKPPATKPPATPPAPVLSADGQPVDMFYIRLSNDKAMAGGIDGFDHFAIETRFGKISIPMDQVAGIKFHVDEQDSAVVVLNNGDVLTGVPTIPAVSLKTDWGTAEIEPKFIDALTTTSSAKFSETSTDFGLRWELKTGNSIAPGAPRGSAFQRN